MSTSFLLPARIDIYLNRFGLSRFEVAPGEWRVITPSASVVFQGTEDRCSDFVRGMVYMKTGERAIF